MQVLVFSLKPLLLTMHPDLHSEVDHSDQWAALVTPGLIVFLTHLPELHTLSQIIAEYCRILQNITEYLTEYYRVLQSCTPCQLHTGFPQALVLPGSILGDPARGT